MNRLDFDTSGLVIFAKCEYIQEMFSRQMANGDFKKYYLCIVDGTLSKKSGIIDLPIARKKDSIIERCISVDGQTSITNYRVLKESHNISLIQCKLETGRTHQIRVHMQALGHPIIGDTLYGNKSSLINRQALHSYKIECIHPVTYKKLNFFPNYQKICKYYKNILHIFFILNNCLYYLNHFSKQDIISSFSLTPTKLFSPLHFVI